MGVKIKYMNYSKIVGFLLGVFLLNTVFAKSQEVHFQQPEIVVSSVLSDFQIDLSDFKNVNRDEIAVYVNDEQQEISWIKEVGSFQNALLSESFIQVKYQRKVLFEKTVNPIPLWLSILPPLIAILMALLTKEVFSSLFVGLLVGTTIIYKYKGFSFFVSLFKGLLSIVDTYALTVLNNPEHVSIIVFSMLIGGVVALITLNGGMKGIVDYLSKYATNPTMGQFITWLMGILIFFDDYANTLVVGNTMRPVTDRLKISREKLAYIVDSTSAPIAAIAFITTWIGAELSYIEKGIDHLGLNYSSYQVFLESRSFSFYPIFTLGFVLMIIFQKRDFGPMLKKESMARGTGLNIDSAFAEHPPQITKEMEVDANIKGRWYNAFTPVMVVVVGTIIGLLYTGWDSQIWNDTSIGFTKKLSVVIGNADSFKALMWSSMGGVLVALALTLMQRVLSLKDAIEGLINGFKTMFNAILILVFAWSIALITENLHTAEFVMNIMKSIHLSPYWIPALAFVFSALISFSTGSSWGTMAIIYPLILPACWKISMDHGFSVEETLPIFYNGVSGILAGSVFGDHCSPISDTTILSSLSSSCNHLNHVKTQMPYAVLVGAVSLFVGTIPSAFGVPNWILYIAGFGVLYLFMAKVGRKVEG